MSPDSAAHNQRLKWCFESCKNGAWGNEPDGLNDVACIRAADFDGTSGRLVQAERTIRAVDTQTFAKVALQRGDLVIEKSGGGDKQLVGRTVFYNSADPAVCSNFLARMRLRDGMDASYINYLLLSIYNARGTYPHIKQSTGIQNLDLASYLNTRVDVPPLETQRRIARYLDRKTATIDALIAKKRALLERLAEKRQALITRAVTKGLDPDAPMKDSGIEWLGRVPAHWIVAPLYARYEVALGKMLDEQSISGDWLLPYLRNVDVQWGKVNLTELPQMDIRVGERTRYTVCEGDLLVCEGGEIGRAAVAGKDASGLGYQKALHRLRSIKKSENTQFMFYILRCAAGLGVFRSSGNTNTIIHLTAEKLRRHRFAFPPEKEQHAIVQLLDSTSDRIDRARCRVDGSIDRLAEYRAALITAAVTGQLEVTVDAPDDQANATGDTLALEVAV